MGEDVLGPGGTTGVPLELRCVNSSVVGTTSVRTGDAVDCSGVETGNVVMLGVWLVRG